MSSRPALRPPLAAAKDLSHSFSSSLSFWDWAAVVDFDGLSKIDMPKCEQIFLSS